MNKAAGPKPSSLDSHFYNIHLVQHMQPLLNVHPTQQTGVPGKQGIRRNGMADPCMS